MNANHYPEWVPLHSIRESFGAGGFGRCRSHVHEILYSVIFSGSGIVHTCIILLVYGYLSMERNSDVSVHVIILCGPQTRMNIEILFTNIKPTFEDHDCGLSTVLVGAHTKKLLPIVKEQD